MECKRANEILVDYLYQELDCEAVAELEAHLRACTSCTRALAAFEATRCLLQGLPEREPPAAVSAQLLRAAAQAAPSPRLGLGERLREALRVFVLHPAMAAAVMLVLVVGISFYAYRQKAPPTARLQADEPVVQLSPMLSPPSSAKAPRGTLEPAAQAPHKVAAKVAAAEDKALSTETRAAPPRLAREVSRHSTGVGNAFDEDDVVGNEELDRAAPQRRTPKGGRRAAGLGDVAFDKRANQSTLVLAEPPALRQKTQLYAKDDEKAGAPGEAAAGALAGKSSALERETQQPPAHRPGPVQTPKPPLAKAAGQAPLPAAASSASRQKRKQTTRDGVADALPPAAPPAPQAVLQARQQARPQAHQQAPVLSKRCEALLASQGQAQQRTPQMQQVSAELAACIAQLGQGGEQALLLAEKRYPALGGLLRAERQRRMKQVRAAEGQQNAKPAATVAH